GSCGIRLKTPVLCPLRKKWVYCVYPRIPSTTLLHAGFDPSAKNRTMRLQWACQPGKRRLRFLGSIACWMRRLTWPLTLRTAPSSTPFSFSCRRRRTRSATLLKLCVSLLDRRTHTHAHTLWLLFFF
ncbi:hypothetical protein SKAU_G00088430, partial [Synaphobranchus kaupii]